MPRKLTASGLELASKCTGAYVLPNVDSDSPESAEGTEVHRQIAEWVNAGKKPEHPLALVATAKLAETFQ